MCEIPISIADDENIVRAIIYPFHVNKAKTRLTKNAFRSSKGVDEVSVIRQTYTGSDFCKTTGSELAARASVNAKYTGLAVLTPSQIRAAKSEVHDSRKEYLGHAHIAHGIVEPPYEPLPAAQQLALDQKLETLRNTAVFHSDPNPEGDGWNGPVL